MSARAVRAVWSGTLSFGLVGIPVKLYPATESKDVRFHLIDRGTGRRVRYRRVVEAGADEPEPARLGPGAGDEPASAGPAPREGEAPGAPGSPAWNPDAGDLPWAAGPRRETEVSYEDLVRGYEVEPGRWVTLEREEIEAARPARSRAIDIEDFVRLEDIDPVYFEKTYHLAPAPDAGAEKPYVLLLRAMERSARVGIGRFVLRTKPHLVAIRPMGSVLGLETLFFGDEIRDASPLVRGLGGIDVSDRELAVAQKLIEVLATEWDPAAYSDEYRDELLRTIAEKAPGAAPEPERFDEAAETPAAVERLMEALRASVDEAKGRRRPGRRRAG